MKIDMKKFVFPSGREALTSALTLEGFWRPKRVAIPEWSSHCVISAVGKIATPIPMREVVQYGIKVEAVLIYEQYGWPIGNNCQDEISERFKDTVIILDRVDSADIDNKNRVQFYPRNKQIDIFSLSKLLGLRGGGFAKVNGDFIAFSANGKHEMLSKILWAKNNKEKLAKNNLSENLLGIHKHYLQALPSDLKTWLSKNDLKKALDNENKKRVEAMSKIMSTSLVEDWPKWMLSAVENDVAPSWVPLFKEKSEKELEDLKLKMKDKFGIYSPVCHFDWAGNSIKNNYQKSLMFPINGFNDEAIKFLNSL